MANVKLKLIHWLDKVDAVVFRHRWYWLCKALTRSSWWGDHCCRLSKCIPEDEFVDG